ncbi:hypothetical protein [Psychromonas sp. SP041]|uniref:hypothetical protein n=1 Tax=Psychromonas sp. SP041 TaxID=1365007 RepID=UPI00040E95D9|nr:hypothetical protein [Psychromonas sp. SP041]
MMTYRKNQKGFVITTELILIMTIMIIGSIVGLPILRDAIEQELLEVAQAIEISEQYAFDGIKTSPQTAPDKILITKPTLIGEPIY